MEDLKKIYKLQNANILYNYHRKLLNLILYNYKNTINYVKRFNEIENNTTNIYKVRSK